MKTKLSLILFTLGSLFFNVIFAVGALPSDSEDNPALYKYNLINKNTYSADSGFDTSTPMAWLWDGSTAQGVNDSKARGDVEAWIEFEFGRKEEITDARIWQDNGGNRVTHWKMMYWNEDKWEDIFEYQVSNKAGWQRREFDIKTSKVRLYARCATNGYVSIHEAWLFTKPTAEKRKTVIGCVGDSNTSGAGTGDKELYSWPAQLDEILGDEFEVKNWGVAGTGMLNESTSKPWVNTSQYDTHKEMYTNISIIALGTNDSKPDNWKANAFIKDYLALIEEFKSYPTQPEIYILIPIKAFSKNHNIDNNVIDKEIRPILRDISKTYAIPLIDGYSATENLEASLIPDGIHPNADGLKIVAEKIASVLQEEKPLIRINGNHSTTVYAEYRWYKDGILIPDALTASYQVEEPGIYKVAVKLNADTDDVIVSDSFQVDAANVTLIVSDGQEVSVNKPTTDTAIRIQKISDSFLIENAAGFDLILFDITGKRIKTFPVQSSYENISINDLKDGMYLYKIENKTGRIIL